MRAVIESARFPRELGGWGLRGALCAASSFWWTLVAGFNDPVEIAGMALLVLAWWRLSEPLSAGKSKLSPARLAGWSGLRNIVAALERSDNVAACEPRFRSRSSAATGFLKTL